MTVGQPQEIPGRTLRWLLLWKTHCLPHFVSWLNASGLDHALRGMRTELHQGDWRSFISSISMPDEPAERFHGTGAASVDTSKQKRIDEANRLNDVGCHNQQCLDAFKFALPSSFPLLRCSGHRRALFRVSIIVLLAPFLAFRWCKALPDAVRSDKAQLPPGLQTCWRCPVALFLH